MPDTTFVSKQTKITTAWAQDVNDTIYKALGAGKTAAAVIAALGLATVATTGAYTDLIGKPDLTAAAITSGTINGTVIGGTTPAAITGTMLTANGLTNLKSRTLINGATDDGSTALQVAGEGKFHGGYLNVSEDGTRQIYLRTSFNGNTPAIQVGTNDPLVFAVNSTEVGRWSTGYRFLAGTATDDGINMIQAAGSIKGTALNVDNGTGAAVLTLNSGNTSGFGRIILNAGSTHTNWRISAQDSTNETFEITPSTAVGGSTFTTPAFLVRANGRVSVGGAAIDYGYRLNSFDSPKTGTDYPLLLTSSDSGNPMQLQFIRDKNNGFQIQSVESGVANRYLALNPSGSGVLVNTATWNGTDALQVAGTGIFTGAGVPGVKVRATGTNTVMLSLADNAATPNEWWLATGITGANDGWFGIYDKRQAINRLAITPTGRTLIGTTTDNGTDTLQVNGSAAVYGTVNGYNFIPMSDNAYNIGSASYRMANVYSVNGVVTTSDARYKTFTGPSLGLDFINRLETHTGYWSEKGEADGLHQWLSAQQVEATLIKLGVKSFAGLSKPKDAPMGLQYSEFIAPLIRAVQELSNRVKQLEKGAA